MTDGGSTNVFIEGIGAHRQTTDKVLFHLDDSDAPICIATHAPTLVTASPNVYVNGKPLGRVTDSYGCGYISSGASKVFANDAYTPTSPDNLTNTYASVEQIDEALEALLLAATGISASQPKSSELTRTVTAEFVYKSNDVRVSANWVRVPEQGLSHGWTTFQLILGDDTDFIKTRYVNDDKKIVKLYRGIGGGGFQTVISKPNIGIKYLTPDLSYAYTWMNDDFSKWTYHAASDGGQGAPANAGAAQLQRYAEMIDGAGAKLNPSYLEEYAVSFNKNEVMDLDIYGKNKDPTLDKLKAASRFGGDDVLFEKLKNDTKFRLDFYADWENKTFQDWAKSAGYKALVGYDPSASQVVGIFKTLKDVPDSEYIRLLASTDPADHWWKNSTGTAKVLPLPKKVPKPKFYFVGKSGTLIDAASKTSDGVPLGEYLKGQSGKWIITYETFTDVNVKDLTEGRVLRASLSGAVDRKTLFNSDKPYLSVTVGSVINRELRAVGVPTTFFVEYINSPKAENFKGIGPAAGYRLLDAAFRSTLFESLTFFSAESLTVHGARLYSRLMGNIALSYKRNPDSLKRYPMFSNPEFRFPIFNLNSHGVVVGKPHLLVASGASPLSGTMKIGDFLNYIFKYGSPFADGMNISKKSYLITASWIDGTIDQNTSKFIIGTREELAKYLYKADPVFDTRIAILKTKVPEAPSWFFDSLEVKVNSRAGTVHEVFEASTLHPIHGKVMATLRFIGNVALFVIAPYTYDRIKLRGGIIEHIKEYVNDTIDLYDARIDRMENYDITGLRNINYDNLSLEQLTLMNNSIDNARRKKLIESLDYEQTGEQFDRTLNLIFDVPLYFLGMALTWYVNELDAKLEAMHKKDELTKDWFFELIE
jgi:uncharacterized Zn-binding protein involved in type VI secretion